MKNIFKKYFVTGMAVIIPIWISVLVIKTVVNFISSTFDLLPSSLHPKTYFPYFGVELIITFFLIILVGLAANNYFGKKFIILGELILTKIPVIKTIYQAMKHLTTGVMSEKKIFSRVVLLEFPIKGLSFIGFVTGVWKQEGQLSGERKILKIFVPTTPNPTSGFFCFAAEDQVKELAISVEDAFKLIISAGYADKIPGFQA